VHMSSRKAAIAAYKKQKTEAGIFAMRCLPTGEVWVGASRHIDTQLNSLTFSLKAGTYPRQSLQAAWKSHGAEAFTFEPLERLKDEDDEYMRQSWLKARSAHWCAALGAARL
jgi:hypothetical protein